MVEEDRREGCLIILSLSLSPPHSSLSNTDKSHQIINQGLINDGKLYARQRVGMVYYLQLGITIGEYKVVSQDIVTVIS